MTMLNNLDSMESTDMAVRMKGRVVLITGGGGGIAKGIAKAFARMNCNFILTDIVAEKMEKLAADLKSEFGSDVLCIIANGANEDEVKNAVKKGVDHFGKINVLINNAQASATGKGFLEQTKEDFELSITTGVYSAFFYMKYCYPYLKETEGSIINFASGVGLFGRAGHASYATAKEAIRGLSRVAATEFGPDNINVNVICPLVMTEQLVEYRKEHEDLFQKSVQSVPLGRYGDAEKDIGRTCVFLANEDSSYITGETFTLQGGSGLRP